MGLDAGAGLVLKTPVASAACGALGRPACLAFWPRAVGSWRVLRGPPQAGRAGGLLGLTRCLASGDDAARWGGFWYAGR